MLRRVSPCVCRSPTISRSGATGRANWCNAAISPDRVTWLEPGAAGDLFAVGADGEHPLPAPPADAPQPRASKRFVSLAKNAALHSDPERFALLYRLLWQHQTNPRIMEDLADDDVRRAIELDKAVRRDSHKMHAFVRFRVIEDDRRGRVGG